MNKQRRKEIERIQDQLESLIETLGTIRDEEQDAFGGLPEGLQESERGERMQAAADALSSAYDAFEEAMNYLNEATE